MRSPWLLVSGFRRVSCTLRPRHAVHVDRLRTTLLKSNGSQIRRRQNGRAFGVEGEIVVVQVRSIPILRQAGNREHEPRWVGPPHLLVQNYGDDCPSRLASSAEVPTESRPQRSECRLPALTRVRTGTRFRPPPNSIRIKAFVGCDAHSKLAVVTSRFGLSFCACGLDSTSQQEGGNRLEGSPNNKLLKPKCGPRKTSTRPFIQRRKMEQATMYFVDSQSDHAA